MSSDTTSESIDDNLSDISAERLLRHVVVGQQAQFYNHNNRRHLLQKLFTREVSPLTFKRSPPFVILKKKKKYNLEYLFEPRPNSFNFITNINSLLSA